MLQLDLANSSGWLTTAHHLKAYRKYSKINHMFCLLLHTILTWLDQLQSHGLCCTEAFVVSEDAAQLVSSNCQISWSTGTAPCMVESFHGIVPPIDNWLHQKPKRWFQFIKSSHSGLLTSIWNTFIKKAVNLWLQSNIITSTRASSSCRQVWQPVFNIYWKITVVLQSIVHVCCIIDSKVSNCKNWTQQSTIFSYWFDQTQTPQHSYHVVRVNSFTKQSDYGHVTIFSDRRHKLNQLGVAVGKVILCQWSKFHTLKASQTVNTTRRLPQPCITELC